jgi:choline dehydrogenase-like flavoprotein
MKKHIVVGAGAAGLLCSEELAHQSSVVLIDCGSEEADANDDSLASNRWGFAWTSTAEAIRHECTPQDELFGRSVLYPLGIGVGGSTNLNAMIWSGGHPGVFDKHWPPSWSSRRLNELVSMLFFTT